MDKELKKAEEIVDKMHMLPMDSVRNFADFGMRSINTIFSEMYGKEINIDSHFLVTNAEKNSKTAIEAYNIYFFLKNLNNKEWVLDSKGNIVARSWKNDIVLDKKRMKSILSEIKKIRSRLFALHSIED